MITYEEGGTGNSQQRIVSSTTLSVTLEGLKKGTQYEVTVAPRNEVGKGKTSQSEAETAVDRKFMWEKGKCVTGSERGWRQGINR